MIDISKELNDSQYTAATTVDGPLLILAGAGSGKTRVVTYRIAHMINNLGIDPKNILAVTFTNKAAKEMKERINKLLGSDNPVTVTTFHSLGYRILKYNARHLGYPDRVSICDADDQKKRIKDLLKRTSLDPKNAPQYIGMISHAKDRLITPDYNFKKFEELYTDDYSKQIYINYQKELKRDGLVDFDDLITLSVILFQKYPSILEKYQNLFRYISVDEYQDTSHAQYVLVKMLAQKSGNLCVVGDDYQSIYAFRGADISNILSFEKDYPKAVVVPLGENYRSTQVIVEAAANLILNNKGQKHKVLKSMNDRGDRIHYVHTATAGDEAEYIAENVQERNASGQSYDSMAILYRNNFMSRILEEAFVRQNIPYIIYGGVGFYQRHEIKDLLAYLRIIGGSEDRVAITRAIGVPKRGIGDKTVNAIMDYLEHNEGDAIDVMAQYAAEKKKPKLEQFCSLIKKCRDMTAHESLVHMITELLGELDFKSYLISICKSDDPDRELDDRVENVNELVSKISQWEAENPGHENPAADFLDDISLLTDIDMSDPKGKVQLMTLHKSKGLEFETVYISGMDQSLFPGEINPTQDEDDGLQVKKKPVMIEEERRLCYVGMTRAEKDLYLMHSDWRFIFGESRYSDESQFIDEIPDAYLEEVNIYGEEEI